MKDTRNVILILVSSKWFIFLSRDSSKFLISFVQFSFRSSKLFQLYHFKASSNHCKASPGVLFKFPFCLIILLLPEFFMEALHGGSSRIPFILQLSSRILSKLRSAKLYSKINMVFNTCFVFRSSSILLLAFRSAILSTLSLEVVLYHS